MDDRVQRRVTVCHTLYGDVQYGFEVLQRVGNLGGSHWQPQQDLRIKELSWFPNTQTVVRSFELVRHMLVAISFQDVLP